GHQNFQIYNWGNDTLKIGQITFSDPSFFLASALPLNIMPYEGKSLQVAFHQTNEGASTGTMRIFSNDPEAYENPMLVALSALAFNPNYIIIPDFECRNIDTIVVPVKVSNIENFVGFQFDLNFPPILRYVPNSAELSVRAKDHLVVTQELGTTALRVVAFSLSQKPFTGDTGAVVCLKFTVNTQDQGNVSVPLTLTNALIGNAVSHNILYAVDNGILSVQFPHTLSGSFVYNNIYNTPLDSVWVFLTQNNLTKDSVRTLANGNYSFSNIYKGTYTLLANTNQPWAGVNGTDALKIMRYVAWLDPFSTHIRVTSADVNNSNSVSGMDVLKVKKRFVGLDSAFARGDWTFEKCSGGNEILMTGSDQVVDFYGLCVGDVNGSHIPGTGPKSESGVDISTTKQMTAKAGQEIFIPISIDSEFDLGALSLELEFPKNLVEIMEVNCVQGTPVYQVKENRINIVWAELTPIKVFPDEPVLFIKVKTSLSFQEGEIIQFVNASELTELSDIIAEPMRGITLHIPSICYSRSSEESEMLIFPNPARQFATLIFKVPEDGKITVSLCDNAGHQIFADHDLNVTEGLKNLNLNVAAYARGNYVLNLVFKGNNVSFREVKKLVLGM
ncbi:MAG: T9SS type A sorting domain-containing protein, partial [Bacteroidota bacterium]